MTERDADKIIFEIVAAGEGMAKHIVVEVVKRADLDLDDIDQAVAESLGTDVQDEANREQNQGGEA